jgi:general secretion pathway protein K
LLGNSGIGVQLAVRITLQSSARHGIALILVLISVVVLAVLAAGFAYSMRVEVKLARNAGYERELEWMGRSGVELARYVVGQQLAIGMEPYDSLNQKWAGGPGGMGTSNSPLADIQLDNVELGNGKFSVKIVDGERKMNINVADERLLQQALLLAGVDATDASVVVSSIRDWIDRDDSTHVGGAEKEYYDGLDPAYTCKNGAIDDMMEMLMIKGVTPELLWGGASTNHSLAAVQMTEREAAAAQQMPTYAVGLTELFTPTSSGKINVNTASATVLQMLPFVDENLAGEIIRLRAGPDGADGTEDDTPLRNPGELVNAGLPRQIVGEVMRYCDVRSRVFEVTVDAEVGSYRRRFVAQLGRADPRRVEILTFTSR